MNLQQVTSGTIDIQALLEGDEDYLPSMISVIVQATPKAEVIAAPGAEKGEWTSGRPGYRSGYYARSSVTRVGTLELRAPRGRGGCSSATGVPRRR